MPSAPKSRHAGATGLLADLRSLHPAQQLCGVLAVVLLLTMLLPWYSEETNAIVDGRLDRDSSAALAITVFSFVEAAIFLVSAAVVALVVARARGAAFHLPGGDGTIVTAAGAWAVFLVFYRFVDQPSGGSASRFITTDYKLSWGIFFGLLAAGGLLYSGLRLRAAHVAEPPLRPGAATPTPAPASDPPGAPAERAAAPGERAAERAARVRATPDTAPTVVDHRREPAEGSEAATRVAGGPATPPD